MDAPRSPVPGRKRRYSRRRVLTAAGVGMAVAAGGGAGAVLLLRADDDPGQATPVTPTSPPAGTPTPVAPTGGLIEPAEQRFEVRRFEEGERIPWHDGVFAMDTTTGYITGYRFERPSAEEGQFSLNRLVGERWILAEPSADEFAWLYDRDAGQTWKYRTSGLRLKGALPERLLFATLDPGDGAPGRETGAFHVLSPAMKQLATFELEPQRTANYSQALVRGSVAAILPDPRGGPMVLADLNTGTTRVVYEPEPRLAGKSLGGLSLKESTTSTVLVTVYYQQAPDDKGNPPGTPAYVLQRLGWDGALLETSQMEGWYWHDSVSPDGRHRLQQETLFARGGVGEGSGEMWPAITLRTIDGAPILRIRSAATQYGDNLPDNRWLADSRRFVVAFRGDDPRSWGGGFRYGVVSLDGQIDYLPGLPVPPDDWFRRLYVAGPVPSPDDSALFSFGRFYLYNASTGRWFIPNLEDQGGPAHWGGQDSPWAGRPGEMIFALGHGGARRRSLADPR